MTAICGMISWACILWTSIRWQKGLKAQGIDRNTLPYKAPFQPYLSYCMQKPLPCLLITRSADKHADGLSVSIIVTIFGGFTTFSVSLHSSSVKDKSLRLDTSASLQRIVVCNDISAHSILLGTCYRVQILGQIQVCQVRGDGLLHWILSRHSERSCSSWILGKGGRVHMRTK